jgi:hypothetical protein
LAGPAPEHGLSGASERPRKRRAGRLSPGGRPRSRTGFSPNPPDFVPAWFDSLNIFAFNRNFPIGLYLRTFFIRAACPFAGFFPSLSFFDFTVVFSICFF